MELHYLLRAKTGKVQHFKNARRYVGSHFLKRRMRSRANNFGDHTSNSLTHTRNFFQSILVYEVLDRLGQKRNAFCGAKIGFGSVGIAAIEHRAPAKFSEQGCNFRRV